MGERTPTAYLFKERLYDTFFGEVHRALDPSGDEVRILELGEHLAAQPGLADALTIYGSTLGALEHSNVVHTRTVDASEKGKARVVTDAVSDPVSVLELLGGVPSRAALEDDGALAIAMGLLEGLASAHELDVVHGGIHPRSLLVDKNGTVKLGDFAVARAVAAAAEQSEDPELGDAFRGFLAPELAFGGEGDKAADVYAAAAIIFYMLSGRVFGGLKSERLSLSTGVRRAVMRALDSEPEGRYADAIEFKAALEKALVADACSLASQSELAELARDALAAADLDAGFQITDYDALSEPPSEPGVLESARTSLDEKSETLPDAAAHAAVPRRDEQRVPPGEDGADRDVVPERAEKRAAAPEDTALPADLDEEGAARPADAEEEPVPAVEEEVVPAVEAVAGAGAAAELAADAAGREALADVELDDEAPTEVAPGLERPPIGSNLADRVDEVLSALEGDDHTGIDDPLLAAGAARDGRVPTFDDEEDEEEEDDSQLTQVDDVFEGINQRDPISEILALDKEDLPTHPGRADESEEKEEESTPLPPPMPDHATPGSFTREAQEICEGSGESRPVVARAAAAIDELVEEERRDEKMREDLVETDRSVAVLVAAGRRTIPTSVWIAATCLALLVLFVIIWTQTDVFHPERARAKQEAFERKQRAELFRRQAASKKGGNIIIAANVDGAAVWMLIGRTPADTMSLPRYPVPQLRLEREGYMWQDVMVRGSHWVGDRAVIRRELAPAEVVAPPPAWPPPVPQDAKRGVGGESMRGVIHVETTPPGAQVWLLVGYTPDIRMTDFEGGVRYEFKVLKDGYRPGFAVIQPEDWRLDPGDPNSVRAAVAKTVFLEPLERRGDGNQ